MQEYQVSFNGNRLDIVPGVDLYNYDFTRLPDRDIKIHKLARRSLSIVTSSEYAQKVIPVLFDICSGSRQQTEATVEQVKALIGAQNGDLVVLQGGTEVKYTATMNLFQIDWNGAAAYCRAEFLASTPIGSAETPGQLFAITGNAAQTVSATFNVDGSYLAEPVINVSFAATSGASSGTVSVINAMNNQGITVTGDFTSPAFLEIDSYNLEVRLNGQSIDYQGLFPTFQPGSQQVTYVDDFSSRTVDMTGSYNKQVI